MLYIVPMLEIKSDLSQVADNNEKQLQTPYGNIQFKRTEFSVYYKVNVYQDANCTKKITSFTLYPNQKVFKNIPLIKKVYMNKEIRNRINNEQLLKFTYSNEKIEDMINSKITNVSDLGVLLLKKDIINSKEI